MEDAQGLGPCSHFLGVRVQIPPRALMNPIEELTDRLIYPILPQCFGFIECFIYYAGKIVQILFLLVLVGGVISLLYAGFLFVSGGGNEKQLEKAKKFIVYGIIGVIVGTLSFVIISAVLDTLQ